MHYIKTHLYMLHTNTNSGSKCSASKVPHTSVLADDDVISIGTLDMSGSEPAV